jgi:sigma-70-like protein
VRRPPDVPGASGSSGASGTSGPHARDRNHGGAGARQHTRRGDDTSAAVGDRRLCRTVLRLRGCLGVLPAGERRVLELRAGVGVGRPRSRRTVARITGIARTRVARLERAGLRRLGAGCTGASSAGAGVRGVGATAGAAPATATAALASASAGTTATHRAPRSAVRGEQQSHHGGSKSATPGVSLLPPAVRPARGSDQTGAVFALIALAAGGYALWRRRRARIADD